MKITAKVVSSPGRTDKFPPPLMRFLRSNAGSRSRGRSRTSPMFVRKNKNNTAIETQEPSSPKVTCMGQVRVRRSSASAARDGAPLPPTRCRCWWIRNNALLCRLKPNKKKKKNECRCQPVWPKWGFFRVGSFRRKPGTKLKEDCAKSESNFQKSSYGESEADHEEEEEEDDESEILEERVNAEAKTPPKNALLLTRCRSAPYRSSSLACRFWSSPLRNNEEEEEEEEKERNEESNEASLQRDSVSEEEPKREGKLGILMKEVENENSKSESESERAGIMLTRCKSEPARSGYKLDPDQLNSSFWKTKNTTRLGFADTLHIITH